MGLGCLGRVGCCRRAAAARSPPVYRLARRCCLIATREPAVCPPNPSLTWVSRFSSNLTRVYSEELFRKPCAASRDTAFPRAARSRRTLAAQSLLAGIAERGADAVGYAHRSPDDAYPVVTKQRTPASQLLERIDVPQAATELLVHVRDYTKGHPSIAANNHPVRHGPVVGIHNGIILNDDELLAPHSCARCEPRMTVDSEAIFCLAAHSAQRPARPRGAARLARRGVARLARPGHALRRPRRRPPALDRRRQARALLRLDARRARGRRAVRPREAAQARDRRGHVPRAARRAGGAVDEVPLRRRVPRPDRAARPFGHRRRASPASPRLAALAA